MINKPQIIKHIWPQPKQWKYLESEADIVLYGGKAGGGKTYALLIDPLRYVNESLFNCVIFRSSYSQIIMEGGLWAESPKLYSNKGKPIITRTEWRFKSGAKIRFAHLYAEKEMYNWDGSQIIMLAFDQLEHFSEKIFWYLLARNRGVGNINPYCRATCNPDPDSWIAQFIDWWINPETGYIISERCGIIRYFYRIQNDIVWYSTEKEAMDNNEELAKISKPKSFTFIEADIYDNQILLANNPEYLSNLVNLPLVERERLLKGNWKIRYQQGNIFKREWFTIIPVKPEVIESSVRFWDKAGTEGGGCKTAGVKIEKGQDKIFYISDCITGQWAAGDREKVIKQTAQVDGIKTEIGLEQEPGSGGKESAESTIRNLAGYRVYAKTATGAKIERWQPYAAQLQAGNVKLVEGAWNRQFINDHINAPNGLLDIIDAATGAFMRLAHGSQWQPVVVKSKPR